MNNFYVYIYLLLWKNLVAGDYFFQDSSEIVYLETNFTNTFDHIFPRNCKIIIHLTRISGLLLYSIDSNLNQLIINLQDTKDPSMKIEFRNDKHILSIKELCKCKFQSCLYEKLEFSFQISDVLNIRCSKGSTVKLKLANKLINNQYPIPSFHNSHISAYLWLINIPEYRNKDSKVYSNAEYLTGCLHNVEYDGKPINFTPNKPVDNCKQQCPSTKCKKYDCLETYLKPKCDCQNSFKNGDICNDFLSAIGVRYFDFKFKIMKLSWKWNHKSPENGNILRLKNTNHEIKFYLQSNDLIFEYITTNLKFTTEISKNVSCTSSNIFLFEFENKSIQTELKCDENRTNIINTFVNNNLSEIEFNEIYFFNDMTPNDVSGDMVYKVSKSEIDWLPAKLEKNLKNIITYPTKTQTQIYTTTEKIKPNNMNINILDAFMLTFGAIDLALLVYILYCWRKLRKQQKKMVKRSPIISLQNQNCFSDVLF